MHSPASAPMSMAAQNNASSMFNGNNNNNNNNNAFNMPTNAATAAASNGFQFNEDFLGPPVQTSGMMNSEDAGIDSLLEDTAASSNQVPILPKVTNIGLQIFVTFTFRTLLLLINIVWYILVK
jgi:hypothetical protein